MIYLLLVLYNLFSFNIIFTMDKHLPLSIKTQSETLESHLLNKATSRLTASLSEPINTPLTISRKPITGNLITSQSDILIPTEKKPAKRRSSDSAFKKKGVIILHSQSCEPSSTDNSTEASPSLDSTFVKGTNLISTTTSILLHHSQELKSASSSSSSSRLKKSRRRKSEGSRKSGIKVSPRFKKSNDNSSDIEQYNINKYDEKKNTSLIRASNNNHPDIVQLLLSCEELDVNWQNKWGNTALHYACMRKYIKIIRLLIQDFRTNSSLRNDEQMTADQCYLKEPNNEEDDQIKLELFTRRMLDETIAKICSDSTNTNIPTLEESLETIKESFKKNYTHQTWQMLPNLSREYLPCYATDEFIKNIITKKYPFCCIDETIINSSNEKQETPLIQATLLYDALSVQHFLRYKNLSVNHQDIQGNTALHCACMILSDDIIMLLLQDYRTNTLISNEENHIAYDYYIVSKEKERKHDATCLELWKRILLDKLIHEEGFQLTVNPLYTITEAIKFIKNEFMLTYKMQQPYQTFSSNTIPSLPAYATDKFIEDTLRLKSGNSDVKRFLLEIFWQRKPGESEKSKDSSEETS